MPNPISSTPKSTTASTRFMNGPPNIIDDALPDGQSIERAVLVAGRDRLHAGIARVLHEAAEEPRRVLVHPLALGRREHADHRDVAAERDRLHAVLGLAAALRPDGRPEADHVLGHLDAEELGGHEVPDLVQADRHGEADHDDDDAEDEGEHGIHPMSVLPTPWGPLSFGCENGCRGRSLAPARPARVQPEMRRMRSFADRRAVRSASDSEATVSSPDGRLVRVDDGSHGVDDVEEPDAAHVERRDRLLVRGVEHRGILAAGPAHLLGERDGGERRCVERLERPARRRAPVERAAHAADPVGPVEAERDRQSHVGRRGLGDRGAVDELDHRVHDRLRVHHHVDAVVLDVEEQVRLDDLESLVHERRGVRRDDEAHVPRGVRERLGRGDLREVLALAARGTGRPTR